MLLLPQVIFASVTSLFLVNPLTEPATLPMDPSSSRRSAKAGGKSSNFGIRPPQVPLDVDSYPVAPPELELEQVHVFIRHGMSKIEKRIGVSHLDEYQGNERLLALGWSTHLLQYRSIG